jgi:hypothetical protein
MRNTLVASAITLSVSFLFGCAHAPTQAELDARDANQCASYGAQPGTGNYVLCRLQLAQKRKQLQQAERAASAAEFEATEARNQADYQRNMAGLAAIGH